MREDLEGLVSAYKADADSQAYLEATPDTHPTHPYLTTSSGDWSRPFTIDGETYVSSPSSGNVLPCDTPEVNKDGCLVVVPPCHPD